MHSALTLRPGPRDVSARAAARVLAEDKRLIRHADVLGPHDLVSATILQDAVLMDAGLVRKGITADDRFVCLHTMTRERRQQLARAVDLRRIDWCRSTSRNSRPIRQNQLP